MENQELQQAYILELLQEDRERGAELLLETYTPLLWSVCRKRLSDPEDIKECINDVFTNFCLNPGQYDPKQASLKNYLAMIADRRAISYHRSNRRRGAAEAEAANRMVQDHAEEHGDLEEAISRLQPEDAQIIRLKYYGGLTYGEIARQMGITEEATKKRGRRSLHKIAKWLIIGVMIAALLAGCVYVADRYFRYVRGMGLVTDTDTAMYQMQNTPDPLVGNSMSVYPLSVSYADGSLAVRVVFHPENDDVDALTYYALTEAYYLSFNGSSAQSSRSTSHILNEYIVEIPPEELTFNDNGQLLLHLELAPDPSQAADVLEKFDYEMDSAPLCWDVILDEVEAIQDLTELGYYLETDVADFLVLTEREDSPETEGSYTFISLCPVYKEEGYTLSNLVSSCYSMLEGREQEHITLTDAQGNTHTVYRIITPSPNSGFAEYTLCFRDIPPGEYTLNIPSLCYRADYDTYSLDIPLPKEDGVFLSCDESLTLPDGTVLHVSGVARQTTSEEGKYMTEYWEDGVQNWVQEDDTITIWHYVPEYEVSTGSTLPLVGLSVTDQCSYKTEDGLSPITIASGVYHVCDGVNRIDFGIRDAFGMEAPDVLTLTFLEFYYGDLQDHAVSVTVE